MRGGQNLLKNIRIYVLRKCVESKNTSGCVIDNSRKIMQSSYWPIVILGCDVTIVGARLSTLSRSSAHPAEFVFRTVDTARIHLVLHLFQVYLGSWLSQTYSFFFNRSLKFSSPLVTDLIVSEIAEIFLISNLVGPYAHFTCILMCAYQSRKL